MKKPNELPVLKFHTRVTNKSSLLLELGTLASTVGTKALTLRACREERENHIIPLSFGGHRKSYSPFKITNFSNAGNTASKHITKIPECTYGEPTVFEGA